MSKTAKKIPTPTPEAVNAAIKNWDDSLFAPCIDEWLFDFFKKHRENSTFAVVKAKVALVNLTYGTRLPKDERDEKVPKHIVGLEIDKRISDGDLSLVNEIARAGERNFYSFASKFCMFHNPEKFAVYDSNVNAALWQFHENDEDFRNAVKFKRVDMGNYEKFMEILDGFRKHYDLEKFSYRDLDHYLWEVGNGLN